MDRRPRRSRRRRSSARVPVPGRRRGGRTVSAPRAFTSSCLAAAATAVTWAPRRLASWITAEPTPPDAPVTTTLSPRATLVRRNMFSAAEYEHGIEASSASVHRQSTRAACRDGTTVYCAKAPSTSEPKYSGAARGSAISRNTGSTMIRSSMRISSTPAPTATMRPHASAPWIRGKVGTSPAQLTSERPVGTAVSPSTCIAFTTSGAYQPIRVLTSVLFTPAAATRTSTCPGPGCGTGTSSRTSRRSNPPCPVRSTALIVRGAMFTHHS